MVRGAATVREYPWACGHAKSHESLLAFEATLEGAKAVHYDKMEFRPECKGPVAPNTVGIPK